MMGSETSRFAMMHPSRVSGIVAVNNTATISLGRFMDRLKVGAGVGRSTLLRPRWAA